MAMSARSRGAAAAVIGVFVVVALVVTGVWALLRDDGGGAGPAARPSAAPSASPSASPSATPRTMTVKVYFHRGQGGDPDRVVAVRRTVPRSPKVATAALTQLLAGPTRAERDAGYWSHFSAATEGMLRGVRVADRIGYADFRDLRLIIPNASSSAGSAALLAELDRTFQQFGTVRTTVYSFNGDVAAFYEWLQMVPPVTTPPDLAEARRVARTFLTTVAGMRNLVHQGSRWSDDVATVDYSVRVGDGVRATGPITRVHLGRTGTSFRVLGATTATIRVDRPRSAVTPTDLASIASPVTVSGRALAFEGTVTLRVVEQTGGTVQWLGAGYATGGGDVPRPFTGQVTFARPSQETGWVLALELSARNGEVTKVTAVRVALGDAPA